MATHPQQPDSDPDDAVPGEANPTRHPVEPEFAPQLPPAEPEDPGVTQPRI